MPTVVPVRVPPPAHHHHFHTPHRTFAIVPHTVPKELVPGFRHHYGASTQLQLQQPTQSDYLNDADDLRTNIANYNRDYVSQLAIRTASPQTPSTCLSAPPGRY